jgi:hypothetical protein
MVADELTEQSGIAATPPTEAARMDTPQQPSSWPTVLGVIAVAFGILGILGGLWGIIAPFVMNAMIAAMGPSPPTAMIETMQQSKAWTVVASLLNVIVAILLLSGGVGLLKRRGWAPRVSMAWAVLKMVLVMVGVGIGYVVQQRMAETMIQHGSGGPAPPAFLTGLALLGLCFSVAWGWALPVFMLIWFSRSSIRGETKGWT